MEMLIGAGIMLVGVLVGAAINHGNTNKTKKEDI